MLQPGVDELHFLVVPIPAPTLGSRFRFPVLEGLVMVPIPEPWQKEKLAKNTNGGPVLPEVREQVSVGGVPLWGGWRTQRLGNIRGRLRQRVASLEIHEITIETGI